MRSLFSTFPSWFTSSLMIDVIIAGAEWIASDLRNILSEEHRKYYAEMLSSEIAKEEDSDLLNDMLDFSDSGKYITICRALTRMAEILQS